VWGDAYIEKWISLVPGYNRVFKVHYKITHFGTDTYTEALQELPVAYVNPNITNFLYYGGSAPWTNGALTPFAAPGQCCTNTGLALFTPGQFPDIQVFNAFSTLQLTPLRPFSWGPTYGA